MYDSPEAEPMAAMSLATSSSKTSPISKEPHVSLRVDQPVERCQMQAHAFFRSMGSIADKDEATLDFTWYRSSMSRACANVSCPRQGDGNVLLLVANIECVLCCRLGITREHSCFCSAECFRLAWQQHKQLHDEGTIRPSKNETSDSIVWKSQQQNINRHCPPREESWIQVRRGTRVYMPTVADVGHILRVECTVRTPFGEQVLSSTQDTGIVLPFPPYPPKRPMLAGSYGDRSAPRMRQVGAFRVLTYNILAEIYATRQVYPYCPMWALTWPFRRELLKRELQSYNADIICLQEVQGDHYKNDLHALFSEWGYDGWYVKKTREAMGLEGKVDGCALFYKRNRFVMKEQYPIAFNKLAHEFLRNISDEYDLTYTTGTEASRQAFQSRLAWMRKRLMRDNVCQMAVLEAVPTSSETSRTGKQQSGPLLCIANVHLFSNPRFPDVKLWQANALVKQMEQLVLSRDLPVILCGDFNSEPSSSVYELISQNHVPMNHRDLDAWSSIYSSMDFGHDLSLASAYASVFGDEPEYTNYTDHWSGVIDYVWYSPGKLSAFAGLKVHSPDVLTDYSKTALPNCQFMSDHVALCIDFFLTMHSSTNGTFM